MSETIQRSVLSKADLNRFTGSENWYRHPLARSVLYTDGAKFVADTVGAYWLLDEIAFAQSEPKVKREEFQVWKLVVADDSTATLICEDGNDHAVWTKALTFTDFPAPGIEFWCAGGVIYLPSEH